ncbi:MAG: glycosyltransferase family 2 protein [Anaerolineae bacterium]|nr:glycosyltransferase family 2 protein [Anaerolineae bacterium]
MNPLLSIVIPAHNEEHRLPSTLDAIGVFIKKQSYPVEVLVVENGSQDNTLAFCQKYAAGVDWLRVFHEDQRGKGLAVKRGMLEAYGDYRFICDADLSMPIEEVNRFLPPQLNNFDVAIGSREGPGAQRFNEPFYRHLIGRVFNTMVRVITLPGLQDTQCGFKCFHGAVADEVFKLQTMAGMSFDVEVLYIARRLGYKIIEVGIPWYFNAESRVRLIDDSVRMAADLMQIRRNGRAGLYERSRLAPIPE